MEKKITEKMEIRDRVVDASLVYGEDKKIARGKSEKSLTELTTISTPSERALASLPERSLPSPEVHAIALEIHGSLVVVLDHHVHFIPARLLDITISSRSAVQGTRRLGAHDALHRGRQFLLQIWTL